MPQAMKSHRQEILTPRQDYAARNHRDTRQRRGPDAMRDRREIVSFFMRFQRVFTTQNAKEQKPIRSPDDRRTRSSLLATQNAAVIDATRERISGPYTHPIKMNSHQTYTISAARIPPLIDAAIDASAKKASRATKDSPCLQQRVHGPQKSPPRRLDRPATPTATAPSQTRPAKRQHRRKETSSRMSSSIRVATDTAVTQAPHRGTTKSSQLHPDMRQGREEDPCSRARNDHQRHHRKEPEQSATNTDTKNTEALA